MGFRFGWRFEASVAPSGGKCVILLVLAAALVPATAFASSASGLFYERILMREAGARCGLFSPSIAAALAASSLQARGAASRAGLSRQDLNATQDRATTMAYAIPCASPDLATAANRVRTAFAGYSKINDMSFPGDLASWRAARRPSPMMVGGKPVEGPGWRLSQAAKPDAPGVLATFGLASDPQSPTIVTTEHDALKATYALLIVRDSAKAPDPYIDPRINGLAGRAPPTSVTRSFVAKSRGPAPITLAPGGISHAAMFSFPPAAAKALEGLDPREAVTIQFVYLGRMGQRTSRTLVEVGDFAAGRAFLAAR